MEKIELLPGIQEYLEENDASRAVSARGMHEFVLRLRAKTGLPKSVCKLLISLFFHEIRKAMLQGDIVVFRGFGKFFISSPKITNNKIRIFPKFKPYSNLISKMND